MKENPVEVAVARLVASGFAAPEEILGCVQSEIAAIERQAQVKLPRTYCEFLTRMGRSAGVFMEGSDFLYPAVIGLRGQAEGLLTETEVEWSLEASTFVFLGHQGYQFLYFDTKMGDDPPVWRLIEGERPEEVFPSFSRWLTQCVEDEIAA